MTRPGWCTINGGLSACAAWAGSRPWRRKRPRRKIHGDLGIAHTRWATHGAPTEHNAHPHISGGLAVVHNGIIENHEQLREELKALGYRFESETDTEVIAHLIHHHYQQDKDLLMRHPQGDQGTGRRVCHRRGA